MIFPITGNNEKFFFKEKRKKKKFMVQKFGMGYYPFCIVRKKLYCRILRCIAIGWEVQLYCNTIVTETGLRAEKDSVAIQKLYCD